MPLYFYTKLCNLLLYIQNMYSFTFDNPCSKLSIFNWQFVFPYNVPRFLFHHWMLNISIIINTYVPKLPLNEKVNFFCFERLSLSLLVSKHSQKQTSSEIVDWKRHEKYPNDGFEKLCEEGREYVNGKNMSDFP